MTRTEAETAVKTKAKVFDYLGVCSGTVEGWADPDRVFVRWEGSAFLETDYYEDLFLQKEDQ